MNRIGGKTWGLWMLVVLILAITIGLRLLFAGGDWGCIADANPGLCSTIKGGTP